MSKYLNKISRIKEKRGKKVNGFNPLTLGKFTHKPLNLAQTHGFLNYLKSNLGKHRIIVKFLRSDKLYDYIEIYIDGKLFLDDYLIFNKEFFKGGKAFTVHDGDNKSIEATKKSIKLELDIFGNDANKNKYNKYEMIKKSFTEANIEMDNKLKIACAKRSLIVINYPESDTEFKDKFIDKYGFNPCILWNIN